MNSQFWWALRHYWHKPSFMQSGYKPNTFIRYCTITKEYYINPMYRLYPKNSWTWFKYDLRGLLERVWRKMVWIQPFRCNGNAGGWRTDLCEWLENRARFHEDCEY